MSKGLITYIPPELEDELKSVMTRMNLKKRSDGFRLIVQNSRVSQNILSSMEVHARNFWNIKNKRRR